MKFDFGARIKQLRLAMRKPPRYIDCDETVAGIQEIMGDYAAAIGTRRRIIDILREDWNVTEGEGVDVHLREIERLEARMESSGVK